MRRRLGVLLVLGAITLHAQEPDIQRYVAMAEAGEIDAVREQLPTLVRQYPNNPGVLYLQALLTTDGAEAVRQYQHIVDSFPTSEWADDALYRIYKFYYALGLYRTAEQKLDLLRTKYPNSRYVAGIAGAEETVADTSSVEQRAVTREAPPPPAAETPRTTGEPLRREHQAPPDRVSDVPLQRSFTVQVGAYSTAANANRQKSFFDYHNYQADVVRKMRGDREIFVVYVGTFATENEARQLGEQLRRTFNIDYIIVTR